MADDTHELLLELGPPPGLAQQVLPLRLGALLLGDVLHRPGHAEGSAFVVADHVAPVHHEGIRPISSLEAVLVLPTVRPRLQRSLEPSQDSRAILRVDALPPPLRVTVE